MKPFFSIRIDYNPADTADMVSCNQNTLRLVLARETDWDEKESSSQDAGNVGSIVARAITWLENQAKMRRELLPWVLACTSRHTLLSAMEEFSYLLDDEKRDELLAAIEKGRKRSQEVSGPAEDES